MTNYYRLMLGKRSAHAANCFAGGFVGADFGIAVDLTNQLPDEWRAFNLTFVPVYLEAFPEKTRVAAGLACGSLWTVAKGMRPDDVVLCPDGQGTYRVGLINGEYFYAPSQILPHRRPVRWLETTIAREAMSEALRNSTGSIGTVSSVSGHREELERLIGGVEPPPSLLSTVPDVEDPVALAMESHLEEFLIQNWPHTDLGKSFDIYEDEGERVGQQYMTDTGPLDILAISKDRKRLLVVELKRGRTTDVVVGQTLRYMGYVREELAELGQTVEGAIIAHEDDVRLRRTLGMLPHVTFYRYQVSFKLVKAGE